MTIVVATNRKPGAGVRRGFWYKLNTWFASFRDVCIQLTQFWTRTNSALRDYYGRAHLLLPRLLKSSLQTSRRDQGKQYFGIWSLGYVAVVLHRCMPTKRWTDAKGSQKHSQVSLSTSARGCVIVSVLLRCHPITIGVSVLGNLMPWIHGHIW